MIYMTILGILLVLIGFATTFIIIKNAADNEGVSFKEEIENLVSGE